MNSLSKTFVPKEIESKWYSFWEENKLFNAKVDPKKKPYTIMIPPPNITGILTMGHVLNNAIQDLLIRWKKMEGYETLWLPGTDHAGIATQNVVEKSLLKQGIKKSDLGREKFLEKVWEWKNQYGGTIIKQLRKLGSSCDWEKERFTMDEGLSKAVQEIFIRLYEKGLIYRGKYIVNWCPKDQTAISDDEVNYVEQNGNLWHLKYPIKNSDEFIVVATTRPETMLGDTAVAVNPKDERYKNLIGKFVLLPIVNREIPIIADDFVDMSFGTGAVKVTPAHDPNDYWIGIRHKLPQKNIFDERAKLNSNVPEKYRGLDRYECRKILLEDLSSQNFLLKTEQHINKIGKCYRCDTVIEPYLSNQWFVKMEPLAKEALKVVQDGKIKFHPERWEKVYEHWMINIRDWCISRQLWWGHRIPVWYCVGDEKCNIECKKPIVSILKPEKCLACGSTNLKQDEDVLDTWFSSWLWPFSTLGWPNKSEELKYFFPTNTLVTGPDIIFFWVARMIMSSLETMNDIPFKDVYFTSIIRDLQGRKMSKSLGNSPDPIDVIDEYGADALRFSILFLAPLGQDVRFSSEKCEIGRNFANKIWNAGRFLLMNKENFSDFSVEDKIEFDYTDRWILSKLNSTIKNYTNALSNFEINAATKIIYDFLWHNFCDWYLEMLKSKLYSDVSNSEKIVSLKNAMNVFENSLQLLHPIMPFVTEELWQNVSSNKNVKSIMLSNFPCVNENLIDNEIESNVFFFQQVVDAIRNIRGELNVPNNSEIEVYFRCEKNEVEKILQFENQIKKLAKVRSISFLEDEKIQLKNVANAVCGSVEIFVLLEGIIDIAKEKERMKKEIEKLQNLFNVSSSKMENENFISRAPKEVLEKEKEKIASYKDTLEKLNHIYKNFE